eukprot:COSAG06_NODE_10329_length_1701_cov_1.928215_1_plen_110_part_10
MPPKPVCPVALAEAEAVVLMAFPCVYAGDDAARPWPFAARVRAASCPSAASFPTVFGILGGRAFPWWRRRRSVSLLGAAAAVSLPRTPLVRRTRPHLGRHPHPPAARPRA